MALTDEIIGALTEQIQAIEPTMTEPLIVAVLQRLESFGYSTTETDVYAITFSAQKVNQNIRLFCNIQEIPDDIFCIVVDMICGEFLSIQYRTGKIALDGFDLDGAVSQVSEGDTSVSFDNNTSNDAKFSTLLAMLTDRKGDLECFRKVRW